MVVADRVVSAQQKEKKKGTVAKKTLAWASKLLSETVVDCSQNPVRKPFNHTSTWPTLCTSSVLYHFGLDRVLLPIEHLHLQGHTEATAVVPDSLSQSEIRSLAGEAMPLPVLGLLILSLLLTKGFPDPGV